MIRAAVIALAACSAPVAPHAPSVIDDLAATALRDGAVAGMSIVVMRGDRVIHARGYGFADVEHRVPATEHSVYPLASLSKQFWGVAALQLVDHDRLAIDAPLISVLYTFPDPRVRVRDVLQQTSGLGVDTDDEDDITFRDAPTVAFVPGTWWRYSNRGAVLVRRVVEQISGVSWPDYLHAQIALPLGLASVTTCGPHVPLYDHGKPSGLPDAVMRRVQFVCADAVDVARFERALDAGGVLKPASVAAMRAPLHLDDLELGYGLLTRIADLDGHLAYGHTGSFDGVSVAAYRFPADDLTIVVLINSAPERGFRAHDLVERIARAELALPSPPPPSEQPSAALLADIAGDYELEGVIAHVSTHDDRAWAAIGDWQGPLVHLGGRRFRGGPDDQEVTFVPPVGAVRAAAIGSRFLLDGLARRR